MNQKKTSSSVYISNLSEDVWSFISAISDPQSKAYEIEENALLSDRDLYAHADSDQCILILPFTLDPVFLKSFYETLGAKQFRILVPRIHTGEICADILKDTAIMKTLHQIAQQSEKMIVTSYTCSSQFMHLVKILKEKYPSITTPEAPFEKDAWSVNFFGSKSGIRQFSQESKLVEPDFKMPPGIICMGIEDAAYIAANKYSEEKGVVIKTNKGHSGAGVLIFRTNDLPQEYLPCATVIKEQLEKEDYWSEFPIIIESYIPPSHVGGGFPNVEFRIQKTGKVEFLYYCGMRVTDKGVFKGVEIHDDVLPDHISAKIIDIGFHVGDRYAKEGYRGHFELDFIAARNGDIYVTESNVRRTGGTHVYKTALALFGKDFMHETYTISNNLYPLKDDLEWSVEKLYRILAPILFSKEKREGLLITSVNVLKQKRFGYIVFGVNKKRAYELEAQMESLLRIS